MIKINEQKILNKLTEDELVLDIGGWDKPFNRANYVIDLHPYETRGFHGSHGGKKEYFNKETWIMHDICSSKRLPFKDKQFDLVICSQVLEDIRDPLQICSELKRISKAGYIEVPSFYAELTKGIDKRKYVGFYHHRWLIDIHGASIDFRFKPHFIHTDKRFHFPKSFLSELNEMERNSFLFWKDDFVATEIIQISRDEIEDHIKTRIQSKGYRTVISPILDKRENFLNQVRKLKAKLFQGPYFHKVMHTEEYKSRY